jgi:hypothetical protein
MIRLALKPLPRHEDLVLAANKSFRMEPSPPLALTLPEKHLENLPEIGRRPQIDVDDWDKLFSAVECRLSTSVATAYQGPNKTRVTVLECVEALDQLHRALTRERQQRDHAQ